MHKTYWLYFALFLLLLGWGREVANQAAVSAAPGATLGFETAVVPAVTSSSWTTVNLANSYTSMVAVCSPNYSETSLPAVVRMQNATGNSLEIKLQNPSGAAVGPQAVYCVVMDEGTGMLPDGRKIEAQRYLSQVTDSKDSWNGERQTLQLDYDDPVLIGQVMTSNDPKWSTFWVDESLFDFDYLGGTVVTSTLPITLTQRAVYMGKHVGEDTNDNRLNEEIGFIVVEEGTGSIGANLYEATLGSDKIYGMDDTPPHNYTFKQSFSTPPANVVATQFGMDGNEGGWAVLHGPIPFTDSTLHLAIDEDQIVDAERVHTNEKVAYLAFSASFNTTFTPISDTLPTPPGVPITDTITVNSDGEYPDLEAGDGFCYTGRTLSNGDGECTLRAAVEEATVHSGQETIQFDVREVDGVSCPAKVYINSMQNYRILEGSGSGMIIDGYTQCGAAANTAAVSGNAVLKVEVRRASEAGSNASKGFEILSPNNTVKGLAIYNWKESQIGISDGGDFNAILGNFLGTSADESATSNGRGIRLEWGASNNLVGGSSLADRNIVGGNSGDGIDVYGFTATNNRIENNYVGLKQDGFTIMANSDGVDLQKGANGNTLINNVISGNKGEGMEFSHDNRTQNNVVIGNIIGPAADGTLLPDPSNRSGGISYDDSVNNNFVQNNVIAGNYSMGLRLNAAYENIVEGNLIGLSVPIDGVTVSLVGFDASAHFDNPNLIDMGNGVKTGGDPSGFSADDTAGIHVFESSQNNIIRNNMIANNPKYGVAVTTQVNTYELEGTSYYSIYRYSYMCRTERNTISQNSIFDNGNNGIHIGSGWGVTQTVYLPPNAYSGPPPPSAAERPSVPCPDNDLYTANESIASPIITSASTAFAVGTACPNCTVELFKAEDDGDNGGRGEGKLYLASGSADGSGNFSVNLGGGVVNGDDVTATATNANGSTSQFSYNAEVGGITCTSTPQPPINLTLTVIGNDIRLDWTPVGSPSGYNIYRDTAAYFIPDGSNRIASLGTVTTFTDFDVLDTPDDYYYVIRSANACGHESADSEIVSNEVAPQISIADLTITESGAVSTTAVVSITLSKSSGFIIMMNYQTADLEALAGNDYASVAGGLTFDPGETLKTIEVSILNDAINEPDEVFNINLDNASYGSFADAQSAIIIQDDGDSPPSVSVADTSVEEGDTGSTPATFSVTLSQVSGYDIQVSFATADGSAIAGSDYTAASGSVIIPAGSLSQTITVNALGDEVIEGDETFLLNLTAADFATLGNAQAVGTILDNDAGKIVYLPLIIRE